MMSQVLTPSQVRPLIALCASVLALLLVGVPTAAADGPDFGTLSRVDCTPIGSSLRPGDELRCVLNVALVRSDHMATDGVWAEMSLPAETTFDPAGVDNAHATVDPGDPTRVLFLADRLGKMFDGDSKTVGATFRIKTTAIPDGPLQAVAKIHAPGWPDTTVTSNLLTVTRPPADLDPSSMPCVDANAGKLLLGDRVDCTLKLGNRALHEDAVGVSVQVPLLPRTTAAGGDYSFLTGSTLTWSNKVANIVSGVAPEDMQELHFSFTINDDMAGGTVLVPQARVSYQNPSTPGVNELFTVSTSSSLVTTPGVGNLNGSTLGCRDLDGPPTYPGETLACLLTVAVTGGREGLQGVSASLPVPFGTRPAVSGAASGTTFVVGTDVLGTMAAGTTKVYEYRVVVNDVPGGTRITPTGTLLGTSVPSGVDVSKPLVGGTVVTTVREGPPSSGSGPGSTPFVTGAAGTAAKPPARGPVICGSKRTVTVKVKPPKGKRWKSVTFSWAKKSVKGKKASGKLGKKGYFQAKLTFQGLPKGPLKVSVKGVTTKGKTVRSTRTYNLCTKKS